MLPIISRSEQIVVHILISFGILNIRTYVRLYLNWREPARIEVRRALVENNERVLTGRGGALTRHTLLADGSLCRLAQGGDRKATQELVRRHDKWIRRCAGRWQIPGHDSEDVYSVALTGAMKAVMQFDGARNVKFVTFLWYCIRTECEHMCVYEGRSARGRDALVLSLDADAALLDSLSARSTRPVEDMVVSAIEAQRLREALLVSQKGREAPRNRAVLECLIAGEGLSDVGAKMGLTAQFVHRIRERARGPLDQARGR